MKRFLDILMVLLAVIALHLSAAYAWIAYDLVKETGCSARQPIPLRQGISRQPPHHPS